MATVTHYTPPVQTHLLCNRGGLHEEQALNLVCLDPLCRSHPLSCCVCFAQIHKYHKVVGLNKLIDDYRRNVASTNVQALHAKISKHYGQLKAQVSEFKDSLIRQVESFEKAIDRYTEHLFSQSYVRGCVGSHFHIQLEPEKLGTLKSQEDLEKSLRFILNGSLYDDNLDMINTLDILKQNEDRVCALLDKMVYMTGFCERAISDALGTLKFVNSTLKEDKLDMTRKMDALMARNQDPGSLNGFMRQKESLKKLIEHTGSLVLQELQKVEHMHIFDSFPLQGASEFAFGKYRCKDLELATEGRVVKSNVNSEKSQYALAWPNVNLEPRVVKEWSMKIRKCRDFTTENTMAVGLAKLSDMRLSGFRGRPTNCLLVSSQGFVTLNNRSEKTKFSFREGDTLHFRYDPFYDTFEVTKQNGRKLTLRGLGSEEAVYACVRFTYASDQVQLL